MSIEINAGGPVLFALFLVFMVLKLCGVIAWSWWWVSLPLWGVLALIAIGCVMFLAVYVIATWRK